MVRGHDETHAPSRGTAYNRLKNHFEKMLVSGNLTHQEIPQLKDEHRAALETMIDTLKTDRDLTERELRKINQNIESTKMVLEVLEKEFPAETIH